jgi:hypothetical protein
MPEISALAGNVIPQYQKSFSPTHDPRLVFFASRPCHNRIEIQSALRPPETLQSTERHHVSGNPIAPGSTPSSPALRDRNTSHPKPGRSIMSDVFTVCCKAHLSNISKTIQHWMQPSSISATTFRICRIEREFRNANIHYTRHHKLLHSVSVDATTRATAFIPLLHSSGCPETRVSLSTSAIPPGQIACRHTGAQDVHCIILASQYRVQDSVRPTAAGKIPVAGEVWSRRHE